MAGRLDRNRGVVADDEVDLEARRRPPEGEGVPERYSR